MKNELSQKLPFELNLNCNKYFQGDIITGSVEIQYKSFSYPLTIAIELKGIEKTFMIALSDQSAKITKEQKKERQHRKLTHFSSTSKIINESDRRKDLPITIPFQIDLSREMRPSFLHQCKNKHLYLLGSVHYKIIAKLLDKHKKSLGICKSPFLLVTDNIYPGYSKSKLTGHDYKLFGGVFSERNITMSIQIINDNIILNQSPFIQIEIDATDAKSSLANVKLQLLNYVVTKCAGKIVICRNLVSEILVANLLPKKMNFSGPKGFVVQFEQSILSNLQQTIITKDIANLYALRLSVEKNHGLSCFEFGNKSSDMILPVQFIRTEIPKESTFRTKCGQSLNMKDYDIPKMDKVILQRINLDFSDSVTNSRPSSNSMPKPRLSHTQEFFMNKHKGANYVLDLSIPINDKLGTPRKRTTFNLPPAKTQKI